MEKISSFYFSPPIIGYLPGPSEDTGSVSPNLWVSTVMYFEKEADYID